MTYLTSWEEFAKAAEKLYMADPMKVRFTMKYRHCESKMVVKVTDNQLCLQYRTDQVQDLKKIEKLSNLLVRHMASNKDAHH